MDTTAKPYSQSSRLVKISYRRRLRFPYRLAKDYFLYVRSESAQNNLLEYWIIDRGALVEMTASLSAAEADVTENISRLAGLLNTGGVK